MAELWRSNATTTIENPGLRLPVAPATMDRHSPEDVPGSGAGRGLEGLITHGRRFIGAKEESSYVSQS
jgi:hypothetical protein